MTTIGVRTLDRPRVISSFCPILRVVVRAYVSSPGLSNPPADDTENRTGFSIDRQQIAPRDKRQFFLLWVMLP